MRASRSRFSRSRPRRRFACSREHPADVVLLEVGLGGRLDATNVIDAPLATVITPVSMDHMEFLGNTLTAIAGEKAAIIKRGVPVICAEQAPEAMAVIEAQAKRMRAPLHAAGQQWHVGVERGRLVYQDERGLMDLAAPKLFGRHQFDNAGLAIATLRAIDAFKIGMPAFEAGIVNAEWPARMQRLVAGALVDQGPKGCEIWLDGGHNAEGGRVAAAALGDLEERVSRPLVVIAGMMANKDAGAFLANFAGLTRHIIAVPIPGRDNAMPPDRLADAARALGMRVENAASVEAALHALSRLAYEVPPRILITGSLYLAGHVLAINGTPPAIERFTVPQNEMPLESLPAAAREEISIAYELASPGDCKILTKACADCESEPGFRHKTKGACCWLVSPK